MSQVRPKLALWQLPVFSDYTMSCIVSWINIGYDIGLTLNRRWEIILTCDRNLNPLIESVVGDTWIYFTRHLYTLQDINQVHIDLYNFTESFVVSKMHWITFYGRPFCSCQPLSPKVSSSALHKQTQYQHTSSKAFHKSLSSYSEKGSRL